LKYTLDALVALYDDVMKRDMAAKSLATNWRFEGDGADWWHREIDTVAGEDM
jgi:hypothetical protein